jgi:hypothetical protein
LPQTPPPLAASRHDTVGLVSEASQSETEFHVVFGSAWGPQEGKREMAILFSEHLKGGLHL